MFKIRDDLFQFLLPRINEPIPGGKNFGRYVMRMYRVIPKSTDYDTLFKSLSLYIGKILSEKDLFELCWRLAGNIHHINTGIVIKPWVSQQFNERVPAQITETRFYYNQKTKSAGQMCFFQILSGTPCPLVVKKFWSNKFIRYIGQKIFGFTRQDKRYPLTNTTEITSMRLFLYIDVDKSNETPYFDKIATTQTMKDWNKTILNMRMRITAPCPNDFNFACYRCPVGYTDCPAGTHPRTYTARTCAFCNELSYFDDGISDTRCVNCVS